MKSKETIFVIPTHRLRDVAETIEKYDENFWVNGHAIKMIVFDDSTLGNYEKYYQLLEQTKTVNDLYYVGPHEKEQFITFLNERLRDRKLESLVKNLFRPSYGGNRNFTLMYTLGHFMVSADDDMRPYALMETRPESLSSSEICRGKLVKPNDERFVHKSFDLLTAFGDVLGQKASHVPENFETGEFLIDTAMDLETNATKGYFRENSLVLQEGTVLNNSIVKIAQTFRTGTNDIDTIDFVNMYLDDETQISPNDLNDFYILTNFRPVITNKNWRMDCGVAGYDNRLGLPPFFPTRLRFEDYIYRLWIQQEGIVAAHVDAVQNHIRNNYMRNPLASEIFNEEICNLLKKKIKSSVYELNDLGIKFHYSGEVTLLDSEEILEKISAIHTQVIKASESTQNEERKQSLQLFANNLSRVFYGFEPDFFQQNVSRIVDDVISQFHGSLEIWNTLVEICYLYKDKKDLPQIKVKNHKLKSRNGITRE
ncbi:MAG: hypothetical protein EAZ76_12825 [Nostocales cyanobacterium]|nr:MAG: hypothetical protein EAZ87_13845 [Nostocales cyanobacterium]TAF12950.1 MAG: hypothetical protein EAZ76_12825 [Nostocales cyanobacterium]